MPLEALFLMTTKYENNGTQYMYNMVKTSLGTDIVTGGLIYIEM